MPLKVMAVNKEAHVEIHQSDSVWNSSGDTVFPWRLDGLELLSHLG